MPEDKFTFRQRQLLVKAQKIVDQASAGYSGILKQHVHNLSTALAAQNLTEAMQTCYLIQSQAGAFGWPLATEIAGWFNRLLQKQQDSGLNNSVNELFLGSLQQVLNEELRTESETTIRLLEHIEAALKIEKIA